MSGGDGGSLLEAGWLTGAAPCPHVVLSSRIRFARNLAGSRFAPHAPRESLEKIRARVLDAAAAIPAFAEFDRLDLAELGAAERALLKETRLISKEMERAAPGRAVFFARDRKASVMVNEEDHLRIQCIEPGLQLDKCLARASGLEEALGAALPFAIHKRFGYLTACPSNVGTGLRASVMLHLPALTLLREVEDLFGMLGQHGLAVRGFNGENSEFLGDFYQFSNEVTLGRSVEEILRALGAMITRLIEREEEARATLFRDKAPLLDDSIWRSYGVLTNARRMNSKEAMALLSRLRLGIDRGYFRSLTHEELNRLFIVIQPAHLGRRYADAPPDDVEARDVSRAVFLRERFAAERN
ncbi:MAG: ATP--guanido phosphotransferase [Candidatus Sumerlaeia bacterium]|nr:ATP--guanido phosphotransferase [Candidatus Sumerlaeia bacterium]